MNSLKPRGKLTAGRRPVPKVRQGIIPLETCKDDSPPSPLRILTRIKVPVMSQTPHGGSMLGKDPGLSLNSIISLEAGE